MSHHASSERPDAAAGRRRTVTWSDPMRGASAAATMSGVDYLRAMMRGEIPGPPIAELMGIVLAEVEHGRAAFEAEPAEYHYNPIGVVHGGLAATLLDSAMACAVHSTLPAGVGYTTLDMHVHYVRALTGATGRVRCEGEVVHAGSRVATAQGRLVDAGGKLYAHATETCLILRPDAGRDGRRP
jgi:uncharacterized protein (TIGR00369 family)